MSIKEFQQRLEKISPRLHLNTFEDTGEPSTIILEGKDGEDWVVYHFKGRLFTSRNILILTNTICPQDFDKLQLLINEYWDSFFSCERNQQCIAQRNLGSFPAGKKTKSLLNSKEMPSTNDKERVLLGIASDAISVLKEMRAQK